MISETFIIPNIIPLDQRIQLGVWDILEQISAQPAKKIQLLYMLYQFHRFAVYVLSVETNHIVTNVPEVCHCQYA